jgi:hypothetical protein
MAAPARRGRGGALPFVNTAFVANPAFDRSVETLCSVGVTVHYGPGEFESHPPGTGGTILGTNPWALSLDAVNSVRAGPG